MEPTVYIIDDDAAVRDGFARLVRRTGHAVQVYDSAEAFLAELPHNFTHPACAVVDLVMPGLDGIELQARVNETSSPCSIVFVSGNGSIPATVQAMRRGAITFLTKPIPAQALLGAIEEGLKTHKLLLAKSTDLGSIRSSIATLSERERETMAWVITGALNKQIAAKLGISERTVKAHRAKVVEKMGSPRSLSSSACVTLRALPGQSKRGESPKRRPPFAFQGHASPDVQGPGNG